MRGKPLPWKNEYGVQFGKTEADTGGNFEVFYPQLRTEGYLKTGLSLFSIGGGFGLLETQIAKEYAAQIGFLDPSPNLIESFRRRVQQGAVQNQVLEVHESSFQDARPRYKYDLVIAIHSWYYIGANVEMLKKARSLLKPGGKLYIALSSRECPTEELLAKMAPENNSLLLEDIEECCEKNHFKFNVRKYPDRVPLRRYLVAGEFTEYGKTWLAYMHRGDWDEIPQEVKKYAADWMEAHSENGDLSRRWGAIVIESLSTQ